MMSVRTRCGFVVVLAALLAWAVPPASAQSSETSSLRIDVSTLGPQVGERVPDFALKDQHGDTRTLQSILGRQGAVLVFVRSTDWCPYCKTQLVELQGRVEELQAQGLGLAAISYDPVEVHAAFSQQRGITFPLLADVGSETIAEYGLLNPVPGMALGPDRDSPDVQALVEKYVSVVNPTARMVGIAFPGTFILDRQGRVVSRFFEDIERTTMASLLVRDGADGEEIAATAVSSGHLEIVTYPSDTSLAAGNRFSIVLDVTPREGMHIYAPGASAYRVIGLTIAPQPFIRIEPMAYPPSEIYHFVPLDERVPVYQRPFRLVQEIVIEGHPQAQSALRGRDHLTISGTLEYQACSSTICYNPVSLPLSWTVGLRPLVFR